MLRSFFSVIRWVNLLYILLTFCGFRFLLINPLFQLAGYTPSLGNAAFLLLALSVMLVAAGGYIINDYFDVEADLINKPQKVVIGNQISPDTAMRWYYLCNTAGIALGCWLAWQAGNVKLGFIHIFSAAMLWFYATYFKRKPLSGNLLVSLLVTLSIFCILFFDAEMRDFTAIKLKEILKSGFETLTGYIVAAPELTGYANKELFETIFTFVATYAGFAFLLNLVRELVKDMEDAPGDEEAGYRTLPVVAGFAFTKLLAGATVLLTIKLIANFQIEQALTGQLWVALATLPLIQLPLMYVVYKLWITNQKAGFTQISSVLKVVMLLGLAYLPYLRATIVYTPQQMVLPPGIESISVDIDSAQTQQPDTTVTIGTNPDTAVISIDPNAPPTPSATPADTETGLPESVQNKPAGNAPAIDNDLLK